MIPFNVPRVFLNASTTPEINTDGRRNVVYYGGSQAITSQNDESERKINGAYSIWLAQIEEKQPSKVRSGYLFQYRAGGFDRFFCAVFN
jgi:hypothetical protein